MKGNEHKYISTERERVIVLLKNKMIVEHAVLQMQRESVRG